VFRAKNSSVLWFEKIKFFHKIFSNGRGRRAGFLYLFFKRQNEPQASKDYFSMDFEIPNWMEELFRDKVSSVLWREKIKFCKNFFERMG
jgi:hypothetical protein